MQILNPPPGTKLLIAAPANPMPQAIAEALGRMVASYPDVIAAHLPYCFVPDFMKEPGQVLVVILRSGSQAKTILRSIETRLSDILPPGMELFLLPLDETNALCPKV